MFKRKQQGLLPQFDACSISVSGNNYAKIKLFSDMLGMKSISHTLFSHTQRLYCAPVIEDYWEKMRQKILENLRDYSELCLSGDGFNDSPGHSAK